MKATNSKWQDLNIKYLIFETSDFIVYIDNDIDVEWETTDEYEKNNKLDLVKHNKILIREAHIESIPIDHLSESVKINFKRLLGESIARSLEYDYNNANEILDKALQFIESRNSEKARSWYIKSSGKTTLSIFCIGIILWLFRDYSVKILGDFTFYLSLSIVSGALGALLSIILRMGNTKSDSSAGKSLHQLEGFFRIIAGMISAILISLLIQAEIILPIFSKIDAKNIAMIISGFFAGSSERLVPSLINKVEISFKKHMEEK